MFNLPATNVFSAISSEKHFFSVSLIKKYKLETILKDKEINKQV